ncbi:GNAT family N-acetyltransferase [Streptomyces sp. NBC_01187]|uniref:GNAT family N-acetyltransferase n=1 Tax=Streptomyces sp. NBC_01187 TaxID=2903766 RepID=UPI00386C25A6|nr:GNAT family N-acetyltransferase [Streptomyces sp. NBC_01187]
MNASTPLPARPPWVVVRLAAEDDLPAFLALAAEVEHWFGPMVEEPGFHDAVRAHIAAGMALLAEIPGTPATPAAPARGPVPAPADSPVPVGGLLFGAEPPVYDIHWLVVAERARGARVGRALVDDAVRRYVHAPGSLEVITFGADHPGAHESGARTFYERLGFTPADPEPPGPEGGSRQRYRRPAPQAAIAFNANGGDSVGAVQRRL